VVVGSNVNRVVGPATSSLPPPQATRTRLNTVTTAVKVRGMTHILAEWSR
jgi:hypothetical protein